MHMELIQRDDGRWMVTGVYVHAAEVTPAMLREVPLAQLDVLVNLVPGMGTFDLNTMAKFSGSLSENREHLLYAPEDGREPSLSELRDNAHDAPKHLPSLEPLSGREPLIRPDRAGDPDTFYARVAWAYAEYVAQSRAPAVAIAEEAKVPVGTARRWINEARRRGKLRPGRQGKAG